MSVTEGGLFSRVFLVPKKSGGGVETRDRSLKAQRISHTGNLSNGHVSKGKNGRGTGDVCHVPRFIGCVPPHTHENRFASVPMFPSEGPPLHVSRPTVRANVRTVGIHTGSETSVNCGRQSIIFILFQYLDDWLNLFRSILQAKRWTGSASRTVPASGPVGESRSPNWNPPK